MQYDEMTKWNMAKGRNERKKKTTKKSSKKDKKTFKHFENAFS